MSYEGKIHEYSISSRVLDLIAPRFAVRRGKITEFVLDIEGGVDADKRRRIQHNVRTILYELRRKNLVYLVPRVLVVNVPLLLFYHKVNGESVGKTATALTSGQIGLKYSRAVEIVKEVIYNYSNTFDDFVAQLIYFRKVHDKLMHVVIKTIRNEIPQIVIRKDGKTVSLDDSFRDEEAVRRFIWMLEDTFYHYLLYIVVEDEEKEKEFLSEIRRIFKSFSEYLYRELVDRWRYLQYSINRLAEDENQRIKSAAKGFLERVVYACLAL